MPVPLPTNLSTEVSRAVYVDSDGEARSCVLEDLALVAVEDTPMVREFFAWAGQRSFQGWWWSATTRTLLAFESLLERQALMMFDFDLSVRSMSVQPFALLWPRGSAVGRSHVPDLFLRLYDGSGVVVDVRPADRLNPSTQAQFEATRRACEEIGWDYRVYDGINAPHLANLVFLSGYRLDRYVPSTTVEAALLEAFAQPRELSAGIDHAIRESARPTGEVMAACYHLLWQQRLHTDLQRPLSMMAVVS